MSCKIYQKFCFISITAGKLEAGKGNPLFVHLYIYQWFLGVKFATSVTPGSHKCSIKMTLYKVSYINSCYL